ncbi:MAG: four helix bundle protein [Candidatus Omnitrophica bacterium CG12_big_fil_rev_8_21_14_0_65_45_16]|nr:MAG: four helix bundle protein [Candidatus Omnitrophica bacterium CG12_big_fil_rev_8_21_14_0_65_45_16]
MNQTDTTAEKGYKKLIVWKKADELVVEIYKATKAFPKDEQYGLMSQLRRAAVSIAANLVEGYGRQNKGELRQFTNIALGSLAETEYLLSLSWRLTFIPQTDYARLEALRSEVGKLLWRFYKSL